MIKFFVKPEDISGKHIYIEKKEDIKHLVKVLRCRVGDEISISDGEEWEYETEIEDIDESCITLVITDRRKFVSEPSVKVTLYQGVPKAQKMETVIQKTVELGINRIVPVFMERTVVVEKGNFDKKLDRWQKISDEAVKQCKRGIIPEVAKGINFRKMIEEIGKNNYDTVLLPYEAEDGRTIKDALRGKTAKKVAIIIGPEGGFSDDEIDLAKESVKDIEIVTLGKTILRTETAGLAALAMTMYELEL